MVYCFEENVWCDLMFLKNKKEINILARLSREDCGGGIRKKWFFLAPLFLLISLEIMHLCNGDSFLKFFGNFNFAAKLLLSYGYLLAFQALFTAVSGSVFISSVINAVLFYILALVTEVMCVLTGDPLLPTDLFLVESFGNIASFVEVPVNASIILAPLFLIYTLYVQKKSLRGFKKVKFRWYTNIAIRLLLVAFFALSSYYMCVDYNFRHRTMDNCGINISAFNPIDDYRSNGLILTFFPRIGDLQPPQMEDYNAAKIQSIKESYDAYKPSGDKKVNVIAIQNEAWWDPTKLDNVEFSSDPLPHLREFSKKYPVGNFVSPVFAGGTCMPEFEFLTGMSTVFLPASSYPYIQFIHRQTPSIVSAYKDNGYDTVAIHPYHGNFYNRDSAYPLLGFDKFIAIDDLENPEYSGGYISDSYMSKLIIEEYENKTADNIFIFGVSMQNHGGYWGGRYPSYDILVSSDKVAEEDLAGLQDFTQGAFEADRAFYELTEYFKNVKEPVLIVMYGDHLPLLGTDGSTYMSGGMVPESEVFNYGKYRQLYNTPYIIWANYDISDMDLPQFVSGANLGYRVYDASNAGDAPWYFGIYDEFYNKYSAYQLRMSYRSNGKFIGYMTGADDKMIMDYKYIQYDVLHGKRYSLK